MEDMVSRLSTMMDKHAPQKQVGLYIDEWGSWYDQEPGSHPGFLYQQNTMRDAEVAALNLNIFHRHTDRVKMANIAQMINVLQAMILTDKEKMLVTPTYHVFEMFKVHQGATSLPLTSVSQKSSELPRACGEFARNNHICGGVHGDRKSESWRLIR